MNWTETDILGKGRVPDDAGGYKLPGLSEHDFDSSGVESRHAVDGTTQHGPVTAQVGKTVRVRTAGSHHVTPVSARPAVNPSKPAIRIPRPHVPNATESRYGDILRVRYQEHEVLYEALTFRLKSGAGYSPDWIVMQGMTIIACWEVKGAHSHGSHSRSALAWKTAANEWPMILWGWAKWKNKEWLETEILPK